MVRRNPVHGTATAPSVASALVAVLLLAAAALTVPVTGEVAHAASGPGRTADRGAAVADDPCSGGQMRLH